MLEKVVFGASQLITELDMSTISFIVDNNTDLQGTQHCGFDVKSPEVLVGSTRGYEIIVCSTSISEIKKQLTAYGFQWGTNAYVHPALVEVEELAELDNLQFNFLVSSGLPSNSKSLSSGGVYLIEEDENYPKTTCVYEGQTHGLIRFGEGGFAVACQGTGVVYLSSDYKVINHIQIPKGLRPHGLKRYNNLWVIVCSLADCILGIDDDGNEAFRYGFSNKIDIDGTAQHHCNDLEIIGDFAYVSMFSVTGNWKRGIFDGGLVEIDLKSGACSVIINNLTMPHSVNSVDGEIYILDSFTGRLLGKNFNELAQLPGFVRGYDSDKNYFYIGESKNRNFSRLNTHRSPVSLDSKITIIDKQYGCCRSIPLPKRITEIHSVLRVLA